MIEQFQQIGCLLGPGVYALLHRREVVYIGKSTLMLTRLYQHRNNYLRNRKGQTVAGVPAKAILFDDIRVYPCAREDLDRIERLLIKNLNPKCNTIGVPKIKDPIKLSVGGISLTLNELVSIPAPKTGLVRRI